MLESRFLEFKINFSETTNFAIGDFVSSEEFSVGGNLWKILYYPRGKSAEYMGRNVSIFLHLVTESRNVKRLKTIFHVFNLGRGGEPVYNSNSEKRLVKVYSSEASKTGGLGFVHVTIPN
ncbi:unnamed protein product [Urochloa humidicola]